MAPKLFILGATGYVGGDFLYLVNEKQPDWKLTCLVRNSDKGAKIASVYSKVRLVYGDLDSATLIEEESSKADMVFNFASSDHERAAQAIARGLAKNPSTSFFIHVGGTGILCFETSAKGAFGDELTKSYNDWDGIGELTSLPDDALHRNVDKVVLAAGSEGVKTAIICPPTIYGVGRGPDNQRSIQAPWATEALLKRGKGWMVGKGKNIWTQVHVQDLSDLFLLVAEAAANGGAPATWNDQGYYLADNGEFVWGDVMKAITKYAHKKGFLSDDAVESLSKEEMAEFLPIGVYLTGTNSRGKTVRAKKLFGWKPYRHSLFEEIPTIVDVEARRLGISQGHAAKVAA